MSDVVVMKMLVIGSAAVGKSSIIQKLMYNQFNKEYKATIGVDFALKTMKFKNGKGDTTVRIQLWDIAGQEKQQLLTRSYYKNAVCCVIVCDLTWQIEKIIKDVNVWKKELDEHVQLPGSSQNVPIVLMCNKFDLDGADLTYNQVLQQLSIDQGFVGIFETSALTGKNIEDAIRLVVDDAMHKVKQIGDTEVSKGFEKQILIQQGKKCC